MDRRDSVERTKHYRQQASLCATAALATAIAEVRQAYLNLEEGWLCLAPKVSEGPVGSCDAGLCEARKSDTRTRS